MVLGVIWFALVGVLLTGYAIFDGFDLGVGALYPFLGKTEQDKAIMRRAIGPVWDGNEVWLLTGGGALFAAFPAVYATVFSGFYLALMLLLFALIFRAASLEFRHADPAWSKFWDWSFFLGSAISALLFGVAVGNIIRGLPLTAEGEFIAGSAGPAFGANLLAALNPYAIFIGLVGLVWMLLHGASWLSVKATGDLLQRTRMLRNRLLVVFAALFVASGVLTAVMAPDAFARATGSPLGWVFAAVVLAGIAINWAMSRKDADRQAFYGSALAVVGMVGVWAMSIFPELVPSVGPGGAITIANAHSSALTLTTMLIISAVGVPLVLFYFFLIYKTYAGRIQPEEVGY